MINDNLKSIRILTGLSQAAFAAQYNMTQTTYSQYETGKRAIPDDFKIKLSEQGVNLHWLITGNGPMHLAEGAGEFHADAHIYKEVNRLKDSVEVLMTSLKASAGTGQEWSDAELTGEVLYIPKRVARRYPGNSSFAGAAVVGDSMEPTLHDGEPVVFVRDFIQGDGIYVLAVNGELLVKRLQFDGISGKLHIISDNPRYRQLEIPLEGLDNVRILGKVVIWVHGEA